MGKQTSQATRAKISVAMKGKRNAAGKHKMTKAGSEAIRVAQRKRWDAWKERKEEIDGRL